MSGDVLEAVAQRSVDVVAAADQASTAAVMATGLPIRTHVRTGLMLAHRALANPNVQIVCMMQVKGVLRRCDVAA